MPEEDKRIPYQELLRYGDKTTKKIIDDAQELIKKSRAETPLEKKEVKGYNKSTYKVKTDNT